MKSHSKACIIQNNCCPLPLLNKLKRSLCNHSGGICRNQKQKRNTGFYNLQRSMTEFSRLYHRTMRPEKFHSGNNTFFISKRHHGAGGYGVESFQVTKRFCHFHGFCLKVLDMMSEHFRQTFHIRQNLLHNLCTFSTFQSHTGYQGIQRNKLAFPHSLCMVIHHIICFHSQRVIFSLVAHSNCHKSLISGFSQTFYNFFCSSGLGNKNCQCFSVSIYRHGINEFPSRICIHSQSCIFIRQIFCCASGSAGTSTSNKANAFNLVFFYIFQYRCYLGIYCFQKICDLFFHLCCY